MNLQFENAKHKFRNSFSAGNPTDIVGFEIVQSSFEDIKARAYNVEYPQILWSSCIPGASIDREINVGARSASYIVKDRRGKAAFRSSKSRDIPQVGASLKKESVPIESSVVGATIDIEDIEAVAFGHQGMNLLTEYGEVMREASEKHIEEVFFFGDADIGYESYIDYSEIASSVVPDLGSGTEMINKTAEQVEADINNLISGVWVNSKQVFLPSRIELPPSQFSMLATRKTGLGDHTNTTMLEYIRKNNVYTAVTGQDLEIKTNRHFAGAGAGGTDRMRATDMKPENHWMPMPLDFQMLTPRDEQLETKLVARVKFGGYHIRQPLSSAYADGI